jgi:hypothetical protein
LPSPEKKSWFLINKSAQYKIKFVIAVNINIINKCSFSVQPDVPVHAESTERGSGFP